MEIELSKPLLPGLTKKLNLDTVLEQLSSNKTNFEDLRSYFQGLQIDSNILRGHSDFLFCAKVSPNGKFVATSAGDGTAILWDLERRCLIHEFRGHSNNVRSIAFTPDSNHLVTSDNSGQLFLWNLETMAQEFQFVGHTKCIEIIRISEDGRFLVSAGDDFTVRVWSLEDRTERFILTGHTEWVQCIAITKDCKHLISGSQDSNVKIWSLEDGSLISEYSHDGKVFALVVSNDGKYAASGGEDSKVKIWNLEDQRLEGKITRDNSVFSLAFSPDSTRLASGGADSKISLWDIATKKELKIFKGHSSKINCLAFNSDGTYLFSGSQDNTIRIWNLDQMKFQSELLGHTWEIIDLCITPDDKYLISASWDKTARVWNLQTTQELAQLEGHTDKVYKPTQLKNSNLIASCSRDKTIRLWSLDTMKQVKSIDQFCYDVASTSDDKYLIAAHADNEVIRINLQSDSSQPEIITLGKHSHWINSLAVSTDNKYLASASADSTIKIFNLETLKEESVLVGHSSYVHCVAFSYDGKFLASGSEDNTVIIWNLSERKQQNLIDCQFDPIYCLEFTKDNKQLVYGCRDAKIRVWNLYDNKLDATLEGHSDSIACLAIVEGDKYVVAGSSDSVRIWNIKEKILQKVLNIDSPIVGIIVSRDMKYIVGSLEDGKIKVWDLTKCIAEYSFAEEYRYEVEGYDYSFEKDIFIHAIKHERNLSHKNFMNKMMILPNKVNLLHFYAYNNEVKLMAEALNSGCNFINTRYGESPITICISRNSRKCLDLLLDYIIKLRETNQTKQSYIIDCITPDIPELLSTGSKHLVEFLSILMKKSEPLFLKHIYSLPVRLDNPSSILDPSLFITQYDRDEVLVEIVSTRIKWNLQKGSEESIQLLESILESPFPEIYRTDIIKSIIDYKWDQLYDINLIFTLIYALNLVLLVLLVVGSDISVYESSDNSSYYISAVRAFLYLDLEFAFIAINLFFFLYEIYQAITTGLSYLTDFWNYIDIIRSPVCITWAILMLNHYSGPVLDVFTLMTNLFCWIRGLTYFRTFKPTRVFVRMVLEVTQNTSSFLILLAYTTLAYATLMFASGYAYEKPSFMESILAAYELDLGNYNTEIFSTSQWIVFFIASIINCIIMLNLLISILGDSYAKVQETLIESDYSQMLDVIVEFEKLMIWNRKKGDRTYLQICRDAEDEEEGQDLDKQVKNIHKDIKHMHEVLELSLKENQAALKKRFEKLQDSQKALKEGLKRVEEKDNDVLRDIHEKLSKLLASS